MYAVFRYWKLVLILVWAVSVYAWYIFGVPYFQRLNEDFRYEADIYSVDNLYDEVNDEFSGEILSRTKFSYKVIKSDGDVREIENVFDVRTQQGDPIFSVKRLYGVDAATGEHLSGYGDRDRSGYLFAPRNLEREDFVYWHVNYDQPLTMEFEEEEVILGLKVYRYRSDFTADQTASLTNLPGVGVSNGIVLDVSLTMWVEPLTGRMIAYNDSAEAFYYDLETGERLYPWNSFSNRYVSRSISEQIYIARQEIQYTYWLWGAGLVWAVAGLALGIYFLPTWIWGLRISSFLPVMVLTVGFTITFFAWRFATDFVEQRARYLFSNEVDEVVDLVNDRLDIYVNTLLGAKGLIEASDFVSRDEWKVYVDSLNIELNYPGIQGVGYAEFVAPDDVEAFVESVRETGVEDYQITPVGQRDLYSAVIYLEPLDERNRQAIGYDMYSNSIRREAMDIARDTGKPAMSGKVTLVQEIDQDVQSGFLLYLPVYDEEADEGSIEGRRNSILGYVYSAFRMNDFMRGALANQRIYMDVEVYDGGERGNFIDERKMFDWDLADGHFVQADTRLEELRTLSVYQHDLTFKFMTMGSYGLTMIESVLAELVLMIGGVVSVLSAVVIYGLSTSQIRANILAAEMTATLKKKSEDLEQINTKLSEEVEYRTQTEKELRRRGEELEKVNNVMIGRELRMIELKNKLKQKDR